MGPPRWFSCKESACQCRTLEFNSWVGKIPWRRKLQPTPVVLPGESHGQRSLVGYSPRDCKESDMTERFVVVVQLLRHAWLFATPWTAAQPGFPILHHLPELAQKHVHGVGDAIQPSRPLSSPFPPAFNLSQHQDLF